ncbi:hypothetical protein [Hydrogenibacillus sp. N12]|uniref:hypothetical protein n=1 Tax=Hydrogenibacillus sp. N12 TaxID=2866627 RepID=UPI001C7E0F93|nr:hypothetical protein [Hydrogenibacillus sp. N12]QZA34042.1 hypothetical protein K2M58_05995 [Hydrogenibacillus sp. N12]
MRRDDELGLAIILRSRDREKREGSEEAEAESESRKNARKDEVGRMKGKKGGSLLMAGRRPNSTETIARRILSTDFRRPVPSFETGTAIHEDGTNTPTRTAGIVLGMLSKGSTPDISLI